MAPTPLDMVMQPRYRAAFGTRERRLQLVIYDRSSHEQTLLFGQPARFAEDAYRLIIAQSEGFPYFGPAESLLLTGGTSMSKDSAEQSSAVIAAAPDVLVRVRSALADAGLDAYQVASLKLRGGVGAMRCPEGQQAVWEAVTEPDGAVTFQWVCK